ncbi:MAG: hypothetical protein FJ038_06600, partial [Chloroflexi bacterium]|nr:hypothetical protein [Chloroflexota bacterium]
ARPVPGVAAPPTRGAALRRATALAEAVDARVVETANGTYVRREVWLRWDPLDRARLAGLPGQPPINATLVCLDTETTGLATAAGTLAFLVGLGWWEDGLLRVVQLLLPDHADEPALLDAIADAVLPDAWLVTYNGRAFDWPLLVARYRLARRQPPMPAGHLDLLWHVRGLFRHRLEDARLRTVERELLGLVRVGDIEGWEIPGRYLGYLNSDRPDALVGVVRHNETDVASLAGLLGHIDVRLADPLERRTAPAGDLAGLARAYRRERSAAEALACYDAALATMAPGRQPAVGPPYALATLTNSPVPVHAPRLLPTIGSPRPVPRPLPAWTRGVFGARVPARIDARGDRTAAPGPERLHAERARVLRGMARHAEALAAWEAVTTMGGRAAAEAWIEIAKLHEHRLHDPSAALNAVESAGRLLLRLRMLGRPAPGLEADLARRRTRLTRRQSAKRDQPLAQTAADG